MMRERIFVIRIATTGKSDFGIVFMTGAIKAMIKTLNQYRKSYFASIHQVEDEKLEHDLNMDMMKKAIKLI